MAINNVAQKFDAVNRNYQTLPDSRYIGTRMVSEILSRSNEEAYNFLIAFGPINAIPGHYFTSRDEIARFYEVTPEYVTGVLSRNGVTYKDTPEDVIRLGDWLSAHMFFKDHGMSKTHPSDGKTVYCTNSPGRCVRITLGQNESLYSARVFLAMAFMMCHSMIAKDSMTGRVRAALLRSEYADKVAAQLREEQSKKNGKKVTQVREPEHDDAASHAEPAPVPKDSDTVEVSDSGKVSISMDLFTHTIRIAVRDGVEEGVKAGVAAALSGMNKAEPVEDPQKERYHPGDRRRKKMPPDWGEICEEWRNGRITAAEAAELAEMSVSCFRSYATGRKIFKE